MATGFDGFSAEGLALLGRFPGFEKADFEAHRDIYRRELQEPAKAFVEALGERLRARLGPGLTYAAKTNGSISPINNDLRFNPEAPRYKDHLLIRFWEGPRKKEAPSLYVRLTPTEVGFASGAAFTSLDAWRRAVDERGAELAEGLAALREAVDANVVGEELKRVPAPYDADHARGDLLRHKWLQVRWPRPLPTSAGSAAFVEDCFEELMRAEPVHRWLVRTFS